MALILYPKAYAGTVTMRFGPPGLQNGGPNPLSIPPGLTDIEMTYVTNSNWETNISICPGVLVGKRWAPEKYYYVSGGGGAVIDYNGVGLGVYSAFGLEVPSGAWRFNAEFKQAVAVTAKAIVEPYALRLGVAFTF